MRPTISPPMNTASRTYRRIEYRPVPTPPKITSLADRLAIGTAPPIPVNDSIALLTAPHDVTVVTTSNSAEPAIPKRCSLPSMLPPVDPATTWVCSPAACCAGEPCASAMYATHTAPRNITIIVA